MKELYSLVLICVLFFAWSCTDSTQKNKDLTQSGIISEALNVLESSDKQFIDPAVSGIGLESKESSIKVIGRRILGQVSRYGNLRVTNTGKKEVLELIAHPGSVRLSFSEFRLKYMTSEEISEQAISVIPSIEHFVTARGIILGMKPSEVKKLLGDSKPFFEKSKDEKMIIRYRLEGKDNSPYLKKMNMPAYFADYIFEMNVLTHIHWGLEYP